MNSLRGGGYFDWRLLILIPFNPPPQSSIIENQLTHIEQSGFIQNELLVINEVIPSRTVRAIINNILLTRLTLLPINDAICADFDGLLVGAFVF